MSRPGLNPVGSGADVPRPFERTSSPKEADVIRDEVRYAGSEPDPSLGGLPRARDPTARLLGVLRPADPIRSSPIVCSLRRPTPAAWTDKPTVP